MHYLKITALASALAALASASPVPDHAVIRRDRAVVEGADPLDSDLNYRKEKRGTYSKYESNGPYVPMSDEMEA